MAKQKMPMKPTKEMMEDKQMAKKGKGKGKGKKGC